MNTRELYRQVTIPDTIHTMHNVSLKGKSSNMYKAKWSSSQHSFVFKRLKLWPARHVPCTSGLISETCYSESSYIHWKTMKFHYWTEWMCSIFLHYALHEDNQFTTFSLAPSSVLLSLWTTPVVYGRKWSSFVAFRNDDVFCANQTSGFHGDCYNLAPISPNSS